MLLGPRQVGKTTLALDIGKSRGEQALYLDLERPADMRRLSDPDAFLRDQRGKLVIIDEIHRVPELFAVLRGVIDARRQAGDRVGHFLLLGSASIELMRQASESLAGRVAYLELKPVSTLEIEPYRDRIDALWLRGGFPESLLASDDAASMDWRMSFIRSYLDRDVSLFAPRLPSETVGRLWTMLAHGQGSLLNQSRMAASLAVSTPAVGRYLDLLVDLLLVRRLKPWSGNVAKRLVKSPKLYIRDSGITHALLELTTAEALLGHPVAGGSWEGFVIESLIDAAGSRRTPYFYRTADGAEVDLLFERSGRIEMAIEIKRSTAPTLSRGYHQAVAILDPQERYLVHGGEASWPAGHGVTAIALPQLVRHLAEN